MSQLSVPSSARLCPVHGIAVYHVGQGRQQVQEVGEGSVLSQPGEVVGQAPLLLVHLQGHNYRQDTQDGTVTGQASDRTGQGQA